MGVNEQQQQHKLESVSQQQSSPDYLNQATEGVLNQLKIEQEISKNHLEEIKFLKEQLEVKENDIKGFKLSEQNFELEREKLRKMLIEAEESSRAAQSNEISELNEKIRNFDELTREIESKKSEIQFLYDELNIKFNDQELVISKKYKDLVDSLEFQVEEQKVQLNDLQAVKEKNLEDFNRKIREMEENREELKKQNSDLVSLFLFF